MKEISKNLIKHFMQFKMKFPDPKNPSFKAARVGIVFKWPSLASWFAKGIIASYIKRYSVF